MPNSPEETIAAFVGCVRARDVPGLVQLYEPGAVFIPPTGQRIEGHAALAQAFQSTLALNPTLEASPVEVFSNGEVAWICNAWRLRGTAPDGTSVDQSGRSSVVLRRQPDGAWRIVLDRL